MKLVLALLAAGIAAAVPASATTSPPRIAFTAGLATSHPDVVTTAADGTDLRVLTPGEQTFFTADLHPSWSPDGTRIAFDSHRDSNVSTEIYVMNAAGGDQRRLTHDSGRNGIFDSLPLWSPRGDLIAFQKSVNGQSVDLWVVRSTAATRDTSPQMAARSAPSPGRPTGCASLHTLRHVREPHLHSRARRRAAGRPLNGRAERSRSRVVAGRIPDRVQRAGLDRDQRGRIRPADRDPDRIRHAGLVARRQPDRVHGLPLVSPVRESLRRSRPPGRLRRRRERRQPPPPHRPARRRPARGRGRHPAGVVARRLPALLPQRAPPIARALRDERGRHLRAALRPRRARPPRPAWQPGGGPLPPITHCAELRLTASVEKSTVALKEPAVWTFRIDNDGNLPATRVRLEVGTARATGPCSRADLPAAPAPA